MSKAEADIDFYAALEVSPQASTEVISAAYRKLSSTRHPDAGGDAEEFKILAQAHEVLTTRRATYDLDRRRATQQAAAPTVKPESARAPVPAPASKPVATNPPITSAPGLKALVPGWLPPLVATSIYALVGYELGQSAAPSGRLVPVLVGLAVAVVAGLIGMALGIAFGRATASHTRKTIAIVALAGLVVAYFAAQLMSDRNQTGGLLLTVLVFAGLFFAGRSMYHRLRSGLGGARGSSKEGRR
jgi:hypothetical protein